MTEQEWLKCTDSTPMLEFMQDKVSDRKRRLFAVACSHRISCFFSQNWMREAVAIAEKYADRHATDRELATIHETAHKWHMAEQDASVEIVCSMLVYVTGFDDENERGYGRFDEGVSREATYLTNGIIETKAHVELVREIFGNPFRAIRINPKWLVWNDSTVRKIAQSIYEERAFERLPILADALTDAGCDNADLLNHCRSEGPHVKGCWVVDLLLGKE